MSSDRLRRFYRLAWVAFVLLFLVTVAGSIVRASGSGMGCPDWPLCFGQVVPPTDESQLPEGYEETYAVQGRPAVFNAFNTWAEYVNRLFGVLAGLGLVVQLLYSFAFWKSRRSWVGWAFLAFVLTGLEGGLGAGVVASYLRPIMVTLHLALALVILAVQLRFLTIIREELRRASGGSEQNAQTPLRRGGLFGPRLWWWVAFVLTSAQIFLGTRIRETHDAGRWGHDLSGVNEWIAATFGLYTVHAVAGFVVLAALVLLWVIFRRDAGSERAAGSSGPRTKPSGSIQAATFLAAVQIVLGFSMVRLGIPEILKPVHLILAELMFVLLLWQAWAHRRPTT